MYLDIRAKQTQAATNRHGGTGTGAAGQRLADAALVHPQADLSGVADLYEADIDLAREVRAVLQGAPDALHGCALDRLDTQHGMRISHRHGTELDALARGTDGVGCARRGRIERQGSRL